MEDKNLNNGTPETKNNKFSSPKFFAWFAILFSVSSPMLGLGFGILSYALAPEEEREGLEVVSFIAIALSLFFLLSNMVIGF